MRANRRTAAAPALLPLMLVSWLAVTGCSAEPGSEASEAAVAAALERARAAADELGGRLSTELASRLGSGTPAAAIDVCAEIAPAATAELSREGLEIRRTSRRHRNPGNLPDAWERAGLEGFAAAVARGERPAERHEVRAEGGELRYLRPILVGEACLVCHGAEDRLDLEVRRQLAERYPHDLATGFSPGDLRGAFSVRVRLGDG